MFSLIPLNLIHLSRNLISTFFSLGEGRPTKVARTSETAGMILSPNTFIYATDSRPVFGTRQDQLFWNEGSGPKVRTWDRYCIYSATIVLL